jgi:hypothetical protein
MVGFPSAFRTAATWPDRILGVRRFMGDDHGPIARRLQEQGTHRAGRRLRVLASATSTP